MPYLLIANVLTIIHAVLIISVFVGIFLSIRIKRFRPFEALILLTAIVIWSLYGACPLTTVEAYFRDQAGQDTTSLNQTGFIAHYIYTWFNLLLSPKIVTLFTYGLAVLFLVLTLEWELPLLKKLRRLIHKKMGI